MANKQQGQVSIRLDRVRTLEYDMNAFAEFEEAYGRPLFTVLRKKNEIGFKLMRIMLWAGLLAEADNRGEELSVREAGNLVRFADGDSTNDKVANVTAKVMEAILESMGQEAKKKFRDQGGDRVIDQARRTGNGTGSESSGSPTDSAD